MPLSFPQLPSAQAAMVNPDRSPDPVWYGRFFSALLAALLNRVPVMGSATFAAGTSVAVTFDTAEANANYRVWIEAVANRTYWVSGKTTAGFTVNASASNSDMVGWQLIRA